MRRGWLGSVTGMVLLASLGCAGLGKGDDDTGGAPPGDSGVDTGESGGAMPSQVDVLVVLDNSDSMQPVAELLAGADLPGALSGLDWRLGVTTSSVDYSRGQTSEIDAGEAGTLTREGVVVSEGSDVEDGVRRALLCGATCWNESTLPSDTSFSCGDPVGPPDGAVSREYLDCLCGSGIWTNHCGAGNEMQLEAAALALCRSLSAPPNGCFSFGEGRPSALAQDEEYPTHELLRQGAAHLVLIVTDEGDSSPRVYTGDDDPSAYLELFDELGVDPAISALGPNYSDGDMWCNDGGAQPWGVVRLIEVAAATGGVYSPIQTETAGTCSYADPGPWLHDVVAALAGR